MLKIAVVRLSGEDPIRLPAKLTRFAGKNNIHRTDRWMRAVRYHLRTSYQVMMVCRRVEWCEAVRRVVEKRGGAVIIMRRGELYAAVMVRVQPQLPLL